MKIFDYTDYKAFVRDSIRQMPHGGWGQYRRMAESLGIHPTLISQIFNGPRELSLEHAAEVAQFLQLQVRETEYFLVLVQIQRAGTVKLKAIMEQRRDELKSTHAPVAIQDTPLLS